MGESIKFWKYQGTNFKTVPYNRSTLGGYQCFFIISFRPKRFKHNNQKGQ